MPLAGLRGMREFGGGEGSRGPSLPWWPVGTGAVLGEWQLVRGVGEGGQRNCRQPVIREASFPCTALCLHGSFTVHGSMTVPGPSARCNSRGARICLSVSERDHSCNTTLHTRGKVEAETPEETQGEAGCWSHWGWRTVHLPSTLRVGGPKLHPRPNLGSREGKPGGALGGLERDSVERALVPGMLSPNQRRDEDTAWGSEMMSCPWAVTSESLTQT